MALVRDDAGSLLAKAEAKVLLTRGMKATAVHSTDPQTQAFLERMVS